MQDLKLLHDAILSGDAKTAKAVTEKALAEKADPLKLVQEYMMPAMSEVGRRFECNEYFVPELLLAARAMKGALELIRPLLSRQRRETHRPGRPRHRQGRPARHRQKPRRRHARRRRLRGD